MNTTLTTEIILIISLGIWIPSICCMLILFDCICVIKLIFCLQDIYSLSTSHPPAPISDFGGKPLVLLGSVLFGNNHARPVHPELQADAQIVLHPSHFAA